jgi:5-methylthioribose kinase
MLITQNNVCHYLMSKGLVSSDSVVDGDFAVIDVSGRNRNFKIFRGRHPGYFLKQIQNWDPQTIAMLQCETACYWLARNDNRFTALSDFLPEFYWYDPERHILVTELIGESENLYENFFRVGAFQPGVAGKLGTAMGTYHRATAGGLKDSPHSTIFPRQIPWILLETRRNSHPVKNLSPATVELFEAVDHSSEIRVALDELRSDWQTDVLIHGDMRLENCILSGNGKPGSLKLQIVDWELADIGDACWDVGAIIQAFLAASILSLPFGLRLRANFVRNGMRSAIGSFWRNYVIARGIEKTKSIDLFERSIKYAAARMIQTVYEHVQFSPQVSPRSHYLFQISSDILKDPAAAVDQLVETEKVMKIQC